MLFVIGIYGLVWQEIEAESEWRVSGNHYYLYSLFTRSCKTPSPTVLIIALFFYLHLLFSNFQLRLENLVRVEPGTTYVDLVTTFSDENDNEVNGPDVRYYFYRPNK